MRTQRATGFKRLARFTPWPSDRDPQAWGIWDNVRSGWAEDPTYCLEVSQRLAATMTKIHAAGAEAAEPTEVRWRGLPFVAVASPNSLYAWGVLSRTECRLVEPTRYEPQWAERIAALFNEAYAAGLADAAIRKAR